MLIELVERTLVEHFANGLTNVPIHEAGLTFSPERAGEFWIEPRISGVDRDITSRPGEEHERLELTIRCYVKVLHKGKHKFTLSGLVDVVRTISDSTLLAPGLAIRAEDGEDIARLQWGPNGERRDYGIDITLEGVSVPGLDVATLTQTALITGDP